MARRPLVNRAAARAYVREYAERIGRPGVITAVGQTVFDDLEVRARARLRGLVSSHGSGFRTLQA